MLDRLAHQDFRASGVVSSDETGLRMNGKNGWMWVVQTPQSSYFAAVDTRAASVLEQLLGEGSSPSGIAICTPGN